MKISVAQIMHFKKASDKLLQFVNAQVEAAKTPEQRAELQDVWTAAQVVDNMSNNLLGAEVNVKG